MNDKTKVKQFFALLLLSTFGFIMMCASGCGSQGSTQSCEKFDRIKGTTADGRTIDAISSSTICISRIRVAFRRAAIDRNCMRATA
ncbi:MAG: hypothetical protein IJ668_07185 [Selenomonadaceae bacterium]|nr:hypothetical protein [Selenomonadaceae bacterium]